MLGGTMMAVSAGMAAKRAKDARKAYSEQEALLAAQKSENKQWFDKLYNQDITERTEVQQLLKALRDRQDDERKRQSAANAISGATQDAELAGMDSLNKAYATGVGEIAGQASQLKDQDVRDLMAYNNNYYDNLRGVKQQIGQSYQNEASGWANSAANAATSAMSSIANIVAPKIEARMLAKNNADTQSTQQATQEVGATATQQRAKDLYGGNEAGSPMAYTQSVYDDMMRIAKNSGLTSKRLNGGSRQNTTFFG